MGASKNGELFIHTPPSTLCSHLSWQCGGRYALAGPINSLVFIAWPRSLAWVWAGTWARGERWSCDWSDEHLAFAARSNRLWTEHSGIPKGEEKPCDTIPTKLWRFLGRLFLFFFSPFFFYILRLYWSSGKKQFLVCAYYSLCIFSFPLLYVCCAIYPSNANIRPLYGKLTYC